MDDTDKSQTTQTKKSKKKYGKEHKKREDPFSEPGKTKAEIEADRFKAFKNWLLDSEFSIMTEVQISADEG